jgi:hypothetical protein
MLIQIKPKNKGKFLVFLLSMIVLNTGYVFLDNTSISSIDEVIINESRSFESSDLENAYTKTSLIISSFIHIESDADFLDYDFEGSGTAEDPYRIENLHISTGLYTSIHISSTTKHVIIQNCLLETEGDAITLWNLAGEQCMPIGNVLYSNVPI